MYEFVRYSDEYEGIWDKFVEKESINGSFLNTRRFLNYHARDKFIDISLMVYDNRQNLCAVIPACIVSRDKVEVFYSHQGSTFGGIIIDQKHYRAKYVMPLIEELLSYLKNAGFYELIIKMPSDIFCMERMDLFEYAFQYYGFTEYKELSTYIDLLDYKEDILKNFSQGKRTNIHNCEKNQLYTKEIQSRYELDIFYNILCSNLEKYRKKPVHSIEELVLLKEKIITRECELFGCYKDDKMIACAMVFFFSKYAVLHTQYLAARIEYNSLSPMSFLYYSMIKLAKESGLKKVSWGIATEDLGRYLNMNLITSKEGYGSKYCCNLTYLCRL